MTTLTIDLDAIASNWRRLAARHAPAEHFHAVCQLRFLRHLLSRVHGLTVFRATQMREPRAGHQTARRFLRMIHRRQQTPLGPPLVNRVIIQPGVTPLGMD